MHFVNRMFESYSNTRGACYAKEVEVVKVIRVCILGGHAHRLLHINREGSVYISVFEACGVVVLSSSKCFDRVE